MQLVTADLSHWHVVSERLLDDEATAARLREDVAPFVDHVHARVGGPNQIQLNAEARYWTPRAHIPPFGDETPEKLAAVDAHERLWTAVWEHKLARGAAEVLATPEYGPPPYQLGAPSKKVVTNRGLWLQTLDAKAHLVFTKTGTAALRLSRLKPGMPILALTPCPHVARALALSFVLLITKKTSII